MNSQCLLSRLQRLLRLTARHGRVRAVGVLHTQCLQLGPRGESFQADVGDAASIVAFDGQCLQLFQPNL
jgi:hypothetical protein